MKYSLHSCDQISEATSGSNFLSMQEEFIWARGSRVLVYHHGKAWWWVGLITVVSGLLVHFSSCPGNRLKSSWKLSQDIILKIWPTVAHFLCLGLISYKFHDLSKQHYQLRIMFQIPELAGTVHTHDAYVYIIHNICATLII